MSKLTVTISRWGSSGDVLPYVALGWELQRRGHTVRVVANPHYETAVQSAGLSLVPVGTREDHGALQGDASMWDRSQKSVEQVYHDHYYPHLRSYYEAVAGTCDGTRMVIVGGEVASATFAEASGIPFVNVACSPGMSRFARSRHDPQHPERVLPSWARWFARSGRRLALLYGLNALRRGRASAGGSSPAIPVDHPLARLRASVGLAPEPQLRPRLALCLWPEWFAAPQPDWPVEAVATGFPFYPRPAAAGPASPQGDRPILVTTGSVAGSQFGFYSAAIAACTRLGRRAILVSPNRDHVPRDLPAGIEYVPHAPFHEIFHQIALVVHHGGIGTASYALAAGVPQVVMPMRGDQFDNGNRLERLGVAAMLSYQKAGPVGLARAIRSMLESERVRERCRLWQRRIDVDAGLRVGADRIEGLFESEARGVTPRGSAR
jgi:rhamnosyltransferase subunit B